VGLYQVKPQQDVELDKLVMDVAKYNNRVMGPAHMENVVELACRTALSYRGVAHVTIPVDLQSMAVNKAPRCPRNPPHRPNSPAPIAGGAFLVTGGVIAAG
jgi:pyruvate dehydrogenase (quinone)/pyruvate oxidase